MDKKKLHRLVKLGAMKVTLKKGDILYIPPLWSHHVVHETSTIALSTWSPSEYFSLVKSLEENIFSMPSSTPFLQRLIVAKLGVHLLFDLLRKSPPHFMREKILPRWVGLVPESGHPKKEEEVAETCLELTGVPLGKQAQLVPEKIRQKVEKIYKSFVNIIGTEDRGEVDGGGEKEKLMDIFLMDFVDSVFWRMSDSDVFLVFYSFKYCFPIYPDGSKWVEFQ
eukprot:TRINITY_DN674_c0_g1_i16.p2 TRINITY_DN674_c0_g1~~TRINITY_DN674_c0_g1_i16.p2  ORF type:complete len:223 (-),score=59.97 TRINITY_DN674_c0_g1_i16:102-770(-)